MRLGKGHVMIGDVKVGELNEAKFAKGGVVSGLSPSFVAIDVALSIDTSALVAAMKTLSGKHANVITIPPASVIWTDDQITSLENAYIGHLKDLTLAKGTASQLFVSKAARAAISDRVNHEFELHTQHRGVQFQAMQDEIDAKREWLHTDLEQ